MDGWNMSLTENHTPKLLVFAGPNGSGKSTITKAMPTVGLYVNADDIKAMEHCSDIEAAQKAEMIREHLLSKRKDFTFETVLSTERNLKLLERAKDAGYQICAVYVVTKNSDINVARVKNRADNGGHDVPTDKIRNRYERSIKNIARLARTVHFLRIVDNSGESPHIICEVRDAVVKIFPNNDWTKNEILLLLK